MTGVTDTALSAAGATAVGRLFAPLVDGPFVVAVRGDRVGELTVHAATMSDLLERPDRLAVARTKLAVCGLLRPAAGRLEAP